jgi:hypothetical protein
MVPDTSNIIKNLRERCVGVSASSSSGIAANPSLATRLDVMPIITKK